MYDFASMTPLVWQVPLGLLLFVGLGLLGAWLAGRALSSVRLGQLRADHAHLLHAEQTPAERAVDQLYSAVLWFASLLFYVSVPALLVLTLAMAGGLLFGMLLLAVSHHRLLIFLGCLGVGALVVLVRGFVALLRSLLAETAQPEEGRGLTRDEAPRLFQALEEVAAVAKSRGVDRVHLHAGSVIRVREAGGRLQVLLGRGERILHLGLASLRGLTVSELKAILAHEYGHFSHGETRLTPVIDRILTQVLQASYSLEQLGGALLNPAWWFLRAYFFVYLRITAGHGRRRELLADRVSALAYGGDTFARAMTQTLENEGTFDRGLTVAVGLRDAGRPTRDLFRTLEAAARGTPPVLLTLAREELFTRPVDVYDSHPPAAERIERVSGLPGQRPAEDAPALTLFADPERLARELGDEVLRNLDAALLEKGLLAREPVAATDSEQERLAEALALHHGVLALAERDHPDARALLPEALARLEQAAGPEDPFLVRALMELSSVHARHADADAARALLLRALALAERRPEHDALEVEALRELLQELPTRQAA
jgi:Zn-dependent protease with chaperone function